MNIHRRILCLLAALPAAAQNGAIAPDLNVLPNASVAAIVQYSTAPSNAQIHALQAAGATVVTAPCPRC